MSNVVEKFSIIYVAHCAPSGACDGHFDHCLIMDLKSTLVKHILNTILKFNGGFCFMMDFRLIILDKCSEDVHYDLVYFVTSCITGIYQRVLNKHRDKANYTI